MRTYTQNQVANIVHAHLVEPLDMEFTMDGGAVVDLTLDVTGDQLHAYPGPKMRVALQRAVYWPLALAEALQQEWEAAKWLALDEALYRFTGERLDLWALDLPGLP